MASTLTVDNIVGATSSSSIHIPGHVVQVVQGASTTTTTNTTTAYGDTTLSVSITPHYANSKILVTVQQYLTVNNTGTTEIGAGLRLVRDSTTIANLDDTRRAAMQSQTTGGNQQIGGVTFMQYLDSPSTSSAVTYKTQMAVYQTSGSGSTTAQKNSTESRIVVMEIAQ